MFVATVSRRLKMFMSAIRNPDHTPSDSEHTVLNTNKGISVIRHAFILDVLNLSDTKSDCNLSNGYCTRYSRDSKQQEEQCRPQACPWHHIENLRKGHEYKCCAFKIGILKPERSNSRKYYDTHHHSHKQIQQADCNRRLGQFG